MHTDSLYDLKEMLLKELDKYSKGELNPNSVEWVDKLSHAAKNICKLIEDCEEEEYSGADRRSYDDRSYDGRRGSYDGRGASYRRRRDSMGRYSREGYSRHGDMVSQLRELAEQAPDDRTREEMERMISKIEQM